MNSKPLIAVTAAVTDDRTISLQSCYTDAIIAAGGIPVGIPYVEDEAMAQAFIDAYDGFFFTGGVDVEPKHYGEEKLSVCGDIQTERDRTELLLARLAIKSGKPILGICRGCQLLNVALGGSLYQDINSSFEGALPHRQSEPHNVPTHTVRIAKETKLYGILEMDEIQVNTLHHQAIKTLGKGLVTAATAPDGVTEAACGVGEDFLLLIQWHPERTYYTDEESKKIFRAFIDAVKGMRNG